MKNVLILHGLNASSKSNWFSWLGKELERNGFKVWIPDLPDANKPNIDKWTNYIFDNWEFNKESFIVGHSAGAVEILGILEKLPASTVIDKAILVAGFLNDLGWQELEELFIKPFDFAKIKNSAKEFIFVHSDNDPYVPIENGQLLKEKLDGKLIIKKGQGHFNLEAGERYKQFPELLDLIN